MISQSEVKVILSPYADNLHASISVPWATYQTHIAPWIPAPYPRTSANIMYELIVQEVRRRFQDTPGVYLHELPENLLLHIDPVIIRFKKLDERLRSHNYPTQQSLFYNNQVPLPGIPETERITVGYRLNRFETQLDAVKIVYEVGEKVVWHYDLEDAPGHVSTAPAPQGADEHEERLARPKRQALEKGKEAI